ncbi:MAG TPA: DNA polymerase III subunit alpha, partial [Longimicrobiales bacterium]|nr:DNA polymerase III subunit alpha [Longimicrobiales bacterium]
DDVRERLDYELSVITNPRADYSGYFLITQDFINWAKSQGIPVGPGRGSAAGSLVAYVLGITDADPLKFDLLFERFLNPDRVSMPDIDVDFCFERRGEVIDYVRRKYGEDSVGQIITFGTMKSRAVIKDVGRTLGFEPAETDRLAKLVPNAPGSAMTVAEAVEKIPDLKELYASDPRTRQLLDYAMALEGLSRHASVHAAGVVIAPGPLEEYVPICTQPSRGAGGRGRNGDGDGGDRPASDGNIVVTQWDMIALEQAGMLKMDFLGLKTLTVIYDAVRWIRVRHGDLRHPETGEVYARIEDVPLDDPAVYEMLARGGTSGVFQFESTLATDKLRAMRCDRFEDLVATNALIRPGPLDSGMTDVFIRRKLGREPIRYPAPQLAELLEPTYGVITYQEQVMRIAQVLAGFTLAEADVLRKAVGKKDAELIRSEVGRFVERAVEKGLDRKTAEDIGEQIVTFGRYGFNRSHSLAYALLSYQTAWLKRHYPAEFMAALLSSVVDRTDDVVKYIAECRELGRYNPKLPHGIRVLPPDVNESGWKFTPVGDSEIRFGLGAIRGLGEAAAGSIVAAREADGPFTSLFNLAERSDLRTVTRRAIEALIQAGACDAFGHRAQLMAGLDSVIGEAQLRMGERSTGQASLFDLPGADATTAAVAREPALPTIEPWTETERLAREKETLGFFISGHPLEKFREDVRLYERVTTA